MEVWQIALILIVADLAGVGALAVMRRRTPEGGVFQDSQVAAGAFTVTGTIFAVMVGFVFLIAFQSYGSARINAQTEAGATASLYRTAELFGAPQRRRLQGELLCYARAVIEDEWDRMAEGETSRLTDYWDSRIERSFDTVRPRGISAGNAQQNWFDETDSRRAARRGRLAEADPFVPGPIWLLLVVGGLAVIAFSLAFADRRERRAAQALLVVAITTVVTASLLTIAFLDNAYGGHTGSIAPKAMGATLTSLERERSLTPPGLGAPCDPAGHPAAGGI